MKLSIAVITMNRSEQLIEALNSCINCKLPKETEFVIFDNASTDDTKEKVEQLKNNYPNINVNYHYSDTNLGVGGGRAAAFELAKGDIVYFLDDDAVISDESKNTFFIKSLKVFENNCQVASLTTNIYDELFKNDREVAETPFKIANLPICFYYLGGSHFLRKECFDRPLYFNIKYGSEECYPSIKAYDKGYFNLFDKDLCVIHKPKINKWIDGTENMKNVLINGAANIYATKRILYPLLFAPILWMGYKVRCFKHLKSYKGAMKQADKSVKQLCNDNKMIKKIKFKTVIKLYKQFGMTVF
jgi:glycosyltransferase involved in cell wall biosynthesis